jgi:hypothetical protein
MCCVDWIECCHTDVRSQALQGSLIETQMKSQAHKKNPVRQRTADGRAKVQRTSSVCPQHAHT